MEAELQCWKCGASLEEMPLPLGRLAECPQCRCDLHVCHMCTLYDTRVAKQCREPIAEEVQNKVRANFCEYLELRSHAYAPADPSAGSAVRDALEALFDIAPTAGDPSGKGSGDAVEEQATAAQRAQAELDRLFGGGSKK